MVIKKVRVKNVISILTIILIYLFFLRYTQIGCPIRFLFGISCMGCGMTRAIIALLSMDFEKAIYYHPLVFLVPVITTLMCIEDKLVIIKKQLVQKIWIIIIISFFITYLIRLMKFSNSVVQINIKDGFIYRVINHLREEGIILYGR